ncbi:hypothetical protein Tco_1057998 [Tanacetum coccineum]|uniref:Uncharacterized protein n=1 Tax=Tanacetum coccineum TaxID=301880 RepID=A0ABQ5H730_9ASTR
MTNTPYSIGLNTPYRKTTTGGCQFLGQRLISWQCKKQTIVATSTTEAEYVAAANCCGQVLWVQNQLLDYGFNFMNTKIHIDNESTICIVKNPVYHSKTKHIEIRHHFIRDCYEKKLISVEKIHTDLNVADLLTKPFDGPRFHYLVVSIVRFNPGSSVKVRFNPGSSKLKLILVLLGVEKGDARSTWTWKRKCQLSLANWMQFGCFLLKPTESAGYTEIVDFLRRSKLRYALTHNPPIYDSLVKQFWQTATARTLADGIQQLNATIDSIEYTITEESVRRQLQLADASGINMLQNEEIFVGLQNIGSKSGGWDQFGSNIATALICLSTGRDFNFSKLIFDGMISNLKSKSKFLMYPRFLQMILNVQTENKNLFVPVSLTKKIFGNMKRSFQGIHRPLLPVMLTIDAGQPQPSADPTPSQPVPTPPPITQPPPTLTHSVQPPPQPSSVQPTATTPPTQPVETTSSPPISTIPDTQPTLPPSPQIPSPSYHDTEGPSFEPSYHMSPPPSHEPEIQASRSSEESEQLRNLMDIVPRLESRVESLEKELSETKQTLGTEILQLMEKVKKLENKLRKKRKSKETKDAQGQDQDVPSQTDQGDTFATPEKSKGSGEAQEEQISPSTLEAAQILTNVASEGFKGSQAPLGSKIYRRKPKSKPTPTKILHFEEPDESQVNTGSTLSAQVNTAEVNTAELNAVSTPSAQVNTAEVDTELAIRFFRKDSTEERDYILLMKEQSSYHSTRAAKRKGSFSSLQNKVVLFQVLYRDTRSKIRRLWLLDLKKMKEQSKENEKESDKVEEKRLNTIIEEVKEKKSQRKGVSTRRKLKSKEKHASSLTRDDDDFERLWLLHIAPDEDKVIDAESLDHQYPIIEWQSFFLTTKPQSDQTKPNEDIYLNKVTRSNGHQRFFRTLMGVLSILDREDLKVIYELVMLQTFGIHSKIGNLSVGNYTVPQGYPLTKEVLSNMLELKLETEEESSMALELIKFVKQQLEEFEDSNDDDTVTSTHEDAERV